jgi:hypothetical protein
MDVAMVGAVFGAAATYYPNGDPPTSETDGGSER